MADVHRIAGELPEDLDVGETADGRATSLEECMARLARCFGRDRIDASAEEWREAARDISARQMDDVEAAVVAALTATPVAAGAPVIAAGIGAPLVETLARRLGRPCCTFGDLADATPACRTWATRCAPAVAVALLAEA
jgi:uncharacterized hydantoinase/oxoprolinase family protein